jgi:hypothetical protein
LFAVPIWGSTTWRQSGHVGGTVGISGRDGEKLACPNSGHGLPKKRAIKTTKNTKARSHVNGILDRNSLKLRWELN